MLDNKAKNFMWSLDYSSSFAVCCVGLSGGLALFWLQPFSVELKGFNQRCIDVVITQPDVVPWRVTFVYGEPRREIRNVFWDLLRRLNHDWTGP